MQILQMPSQRMPARQQMQKDYGGKTLAERSRFALEVIKEVRKAVGDDFALIIRLSQFKPSAYDFKLASTPNEMESWLNPMADAGIDIFHCSQRRFWEPEFEGSDLNFAGWAKKITGNHYCWFGRPYRRVPGGICRRKFAAKQS
jgi:2,4-dienoyl-CoA reductase-like NADH-dependent reductase (Old Yellow Enzyme family)